MGLILKILAGIVRLEVQNAQRYGSGSNDGNPGYLIYSQLDQSNLGHYGRDYARVFPGVGFQIDEIGGRQQPLQRTAAVE